MKKIIYLIFTCFLSLNLYSNPALMNKFYNDYPDYKESQYSCTVCHKVPGGPLNSYGKDAVRKRFRFNLIEDIDSDEDGFINIEEIELLTNPGDKFSFPEN